MIDAIVAELHSSRRLLREATLPDEPGLYAFFLSAAAHLAPFGGPGDLIYVGKSESSLRDRDLRQHFQIGASGHSTVRRSLGAILRGQTGYRAIPRGTGHNLQDRRCYRFRQEDEEALSAWMAENLQIGYSLVPDSVLGLRDIEECVLAALVPPLNIDGKSVKRNPLAQRLRALRAECMEEADRRAGIIDHS